MSLCFGSVRQQREGDFIVNYAGAFKDKRDTRRHARYVVGRQEREVAAGSKAWLDDVDANPVRGELERLALGKAFERRLRHAIGDRARVHLPRRAGADVDESALNVAFHHQAREVLGDDEGGAEVDRHDSVELGFVEVDEHAGAWIDAGIVDDDVGCPPFGGNQLGERTDRIGVAEVSAMEQTGGAVEPEAVDNALQLVAAEVGETQARPLAGEGGGDPAAKDPGGAGDNDALGRTSQPGDAAGMVLYLCSPAAAYITGAVVSIDGGNSIGTYRPTPAKS